jgi:hemolysin activation/secretion protein
MSGTITDLLNNIKGTPMSTTLQLTKLAAALLPSLALYAGPVAAQSAPPTAADLARQIPLAPQPARPEPVLPVPVASTPPAAIGQAPGVAVAVKRLEITGNTAFSSATLLELVKQAEGRTLTLAELEALAGRITRFYRNERYFVARAYLPAQEVTQGVVQIRVIEGNYGKFVLENKSLVRDSVVQGMLDAIKPSGPVSLDSIERAMLNINATPGVLITRTDATPGEAIGASDFVVATEATARVESYAALDNYGSVYTGKYRVMAGSAINSPFGLGDKLAASVLMSEGRDLQNYRLSYQAPLASDGLRGELSASRTNYELGDAYRMLDAQGTAQTVEATLRYPLLLTQARALEGSLSLAHSKLRDEIRVTATVIPKSSDALTFSLAGKQQDVWGTLPGLSSASLALTLGRLDIDELMARQQDAAGAVTAGRYGKLNLSLGRNTQLQRNWTLMTMLRIQKALFDKNLDGSEDMSVSGMAGVKAYPAGELAGENATLLSAELQYALPFGKSMSLRTGVFADTGRASMQNRVGAVAPRSLSDVGLGVYANHKHFFATLQLAHRTGGEPTSERASATRALFQAGSTF